MSTYGKKSILNNERGMWNKALTDSWSNPKFSFCLSSIYKVIEIRMEHFIRNHLGLYSG